MSFKIATGISLLLMIAFPTSALAASFDCARASSRMEKTICRDPKLSKMDDELAASYKDALQSVSPSTQIMIRTAQREWLGFVQIVCHFDGSKYLGTDRESPADCLAALYSSRLNDLEETMDEIGPYRFVYIDFYKAFPVRASNPAYLAAALADEPSGVAEDHIRYPQIEHPATEAEGRWNELIAKSPKEDIARASVRGAHYDEQDYSLLIEVTGAVKNAISSDVDRAFPAPGNHCLRTYFVETNLLDPARKLQMSDIFKPDSAWKEAIGTLIDKQLRTHRPGESFDEDAQIEARIKAATNPSFWLIEPDGLAIHYETGYCVERPDSKAVLPWASLTPYLNPNSPIGIPR